MNKIIRALTFNDEISLVLIDSTEMVNESIKIHRLSVPAAVVFGKAITIMTYMSGWLKDESGEISATVKGNGQGGSICISGDVNMNMRGTMENTEVHCPESEVVGHEGYMTVIRDDGYAQPFVGSVPVSTGEVTHIFEEYYRASEQLPTFITVEVRVEDNEKHCSKSIGLFLQPLPGASNASIYKAAEMKAKINNLCSEVDRLGMEGFLKEYFAADVLEEKNAEYKCNCSREYIGGVLATIPEAELDDIVKKDGKVNIHCHYCGTDYDFYQKDVDGIFAKNK